MSRSRTFLLLATGTATASAACIIVSPGLLPTPPWAYSQPVGGWTLYPPLSALPQALPAQAGPTIQEFYCYAGLLWGAAIAMVLALGFWLSSLVAQKGNTQHQLSRKRKALPVLLLIPCWIHLGGMAFLWQKWEQEALQQKLMPEEITRPEPFSNQADPPKC